MDRRQKLTESDVREIIRVYDADTAVTAGMLSRRYGVAKSQISMILTGRSWVSVTGGVNRSRYTTEHISTISARRDEVAGKLTEFVRQTSIDLDMPAEDVLVHLRRVLRTPKGQNP